MIEGSVEVPQEYENEAGSAKSLACNEIPVEEAIVERIKRRIERHVEWLDAKAKDQYRGEHASFLERDLANTTLTKQRLSYAVFDECDLSTTIFVDCDLSYCDLSSTRGLTAGNMPGCNLKGAIMPSTVSFDKMIDRQTELAKAGARQYALLITFTATVVVVALTVSDAALLTDSAAIGLPSLGFSVSARAFFNIMPVILLVALAGFQFTLLRISRAAQRMPAILTDGTLRHHATFPWLGTYFEDGRDKRDGFDNLRNVLITWPAINLPIPIATFALWMRYIPISTWTPPDKQLLFAPMISIYHLTITPTPSIYWLTFSFAASVMLLISSSIARRTILRSSDRADITTKVGPSNDRRTSRLSTSKLLRPAGLVLLITALLMVLGVAFDNIAVYTVYAPELAVEFSDIAMPTRLQRLCNAFDKEGIGPYLNVRTTVVSSIPSGWKDGDFLSVRGPNIAYANMGFAGASDANFEAAHFSDSSLFGMQLWRADLRGTKFTAVFSPFAQFNDSLLDNSKFSTTTLAASDFGGASCSHVRFEDCNMVACRNLRPHDCEFARDDLADCSFESFQGDQFTGCSFSGIPGKSTSFHVSEIEGAKGILRTQNLALSCVDFTGGTFASCDFSEMTFDGCTGNKPKFQESNFDQADMMNTTFQSPDFTGASLNGTNFSGVGKDGSRSRPSSMRGANFTEAFVGTTDFRGIDLRKSRWNNASSFSRYPGEVRSYVAGLNGTGLLHFIATNPGPDLRGADLRGATGFSRKYLLPFCKIDKTTRLPEHMAP
jgi:uncharacterized protein YjbI with pentapeptide repeats